MDLDVIFGMCDNGLPNQLIEIPLILGAGRTSFTCCYDLPRSSHVLASWNVLCAKFLFSLLVCLALKFTDCLVEYAEMVHTEVL